MIADWFNTRFNSLNTLFIRKFLINSDDNNNIFIWASLLSACFFVLVLLGGAALACSLLQLMLILRLLLLLLLLLQQAIIWVVVEMPYTCFSCSALFGFINYYFVDKYIMGDATRFFSLNRLLFSDFHILNTHTETIGFFFCSSLALLWHSRIIFIQKLFALVLLSIYITEYYMLQLHVLDQLEKRDK